MKYKDFINEAPMMVNDRVKKTNDTDKWAEEIRQQAIESIMDDESGKSDDLDYEPKFKFIDDFTDSGFKFEHFSLYAYGNVYIVTKGTSLSCVVKYDKHEKEYFTIDVIAKHKASSQQIRDINYILAKHLKRKGLLSGTHQTSGGRSMWRNIIKEAESKNLKFGHCESNKFIDWEGSASDFLKFADDELYDTDEKRDRSKMKFRLFVKF